MNKIDIQTPEVSGLDGKTCVACEGRNDKLLESLFALVTAYIFSLSVCGKADSGVLEDKKG